jgi:putative PIN family toxin of toxin-antitoxin system
VSSPLLVVDTNVVVAGLLTPDPDAPTRRLLDAMLAARVRFVLSEELLAEYRDVLSRPAIRTVHGLAAGELDEILVRLVENAVIDPNAPALAGARVGDEHLARLLERHPGALLVSGDRAALRSAAARGRTPRQWAESREGV